MNLEAKLQTKLKELDDLRAKIASMEEQKQKLFQTALEVQGAAKQLIEIISLQKAEQPAPLPEKPLELPREGAIKPAPAIKKKKSPAEDN